MLWGKNRGSEKADSQAWLPGMGLRQSVLHIEDCRGCLAVVAQWQSTGGSSQRCSGFDSQRLPAFRFPLFLPHNIYLFAARGESGRSESKTHYTMPVLVREMTCYFYCNCYTSIRATVLVVVCYGMQDYCPLPLLMANSSYCLNCY